ncbi:hypothetical protein KY290_024789 [Solanum tuberosum]|uniref:Uncharacterized protein n=1 Tax=Solanum tuberosum TaxID=4113 RepID=A0ABQ7URY1_SOLTU|nr:hypothetical protein KY284_023648 [Solanum tuberosum]KAH0754519.1 hypothetical protein KY290_024789 [Solanum tuberosum]
MYIRPGRTWFNKYCPDVAKIVIHRWFYEWWSYFGVNREILPQQFLSRFEDFQIKEEISTLPEHIKMCKYFIKKRISYILSWSFAKTDSDRIKYLSKEIKIRGWTPKLVSKPPVKVSPRAASTSPSKNALKKRLKKALKEMDDDQSSEEDIMFLLEEVTYENDSGDMLDPTGIAVAYLDSY